MGCADDANKPKSLNPNGDSELAVLMRNMFDDGMVTRQQIIDGNVPEINVPYTHIHTAKPTEEGKTSSTEYMLFAKAYEAAVERFKAADPSMRVEAYQTMINTCMNCHQKVCPGPMVRIKKLYLPDEHVKMGVVPTPIH